MEYLVTWLIGLPMLVGIGWTQFGITGIAAIL